MTSRLKESWWVIRSESQSAFDINILICSLENFFYWLKNLNRKPSRLRGKIEIEYETFSTQNESTLVILLNQNQLKQILQILYALLLTDWCTIYVFYSLYSLFSLYNLEWKFIQFFGYYNNDILFNFII